MPALATALHLDPGTTTAALRRAQAALDAPSLTAAATRPARRPPATQVIRRRHDRIVGRMPAATAVLPIATLIREPRTGPA